MKVLEVYSSANSGAIRIFGQAGSVQTSPTLPILRPRHCRPVLRKDAGRSAQ